MKKDDVISKKSLINRFIMKTIIFIIIILLCYGCDMNNEKLRLVNETKDTIYYDLILDTLLERGQYLYKAPPFDTVWPNFVMGRGDGVWEYKINNESKDSTLHIFILNSNSVSNSVIKNHKYKRLDLKIKDLDRLKWIVVYQ